MVVVLVQVTFQEFKNRFLETGKVEKVTTDGKKVNIFLKTGAAEGSSQFYFNIGSPEGFERQLEDAQRDMGIDPRDW